MSGTHALAEFAAGLEWDALPDAVRRRTKELLLDFIGVACGGVDEEPAPAIRRAAARWGCAAEGTVIGEASRFPAQHAAFANAFAGRIHCYDDTYEPGTMHPGSAVIPAALAASEKAGARTKDFLAAVVAGYEVATRVAVAVSPAHYAHGFHSTGTCSPFGTAAAACRAMGLGADATEQALGLAAASAAGIRQHQISGSIADSALHAARAAQGGIWAAELQQAGMPGPTDILDGKLGFCRVLSPAAQPECLTVGLGRRFELLRITIKLFPSCRFTHGPIDALLELRRAHGIEPAQVEAIEIRGFRQSIEISDRPTFCTRTDRIMSHQFTVATALLNDGLPIAAFRDSSVVDPELRGVLARISVAVDLGLDALYPAHQAHSVAVILRDGRRMEAYRADPPGGEGDPLPPERVSEKFLGLAGGLLGQERARQVIEAIARLEDEPDLAVLTGLLARERST